MTTSFLSHTDAAVRNRNMILRFLRQNGPISRTEIWERLNISRAAVTQVIRQLEDLGFISEVGKGESTGGRKPRYLTFNGSARKLYGFDWLSQTLFLTDLDGTVLYEMPLSFDAPLSPGRFAAVLSDAIAAIDAMALCPAEEILGLGLSLPGIMDRFTGTLLYSVELGWRNVSLRELFADRFGDNIFPERETSIMALGDYVFGESQWASHSQLIVLDKGGIGVASVIHGSCQHGANFMYGELGHIKLLSDVRCSCGQVGCLEAVVKEKLQENCGNITAELIEYLAVGIAASINLSDVCSVLLVGSYADLLTQTQRDALVSAVREKVTGGHLRRLELRFCSDMRTLAKNGLAACVFDRCFAVE